jgi:hypothetical protein
MTMDRTAEMLDVHDKDLVFLIGGDLLFEERFCQCLVDR